MHQQEQQQIAVNANQIEGYDPMFSLKMDNFDIFDGKYFFISNHFRPFLLESWQFLVYALQDRCPYTTVNSLGISLSPPNVQLLFGAPHSLLSVCQLCP